MISDWNVTNFANDGGPWAVTRVREPRPSLHRVDRRRPRTSLVWTVRDGQSLWLVSERTGVPVTRLARDNGIKNTSMIHVGQRLVVNLNG
jgi:hypothetical protein